jgi:hypothetical protein
MLIREACPQGKSPKYQKNGHIHHGQQKHHGHDWGRQFVQRFEPCLIVEDKRALIERWLVERIA